MNAYLAISAYILGAILYGIWCFKDADFTVAIESVDGLTEIMPWIAVFMILTFMLIFVFSIWPVWLLLRMTGDIKKLKK